MDTSSTTTTVSVDPRLVSWTHWMYALHATALAIGVLTSATIAGKFVFGLPSIIAVVMNYMRRGEARGTWLEPHFSWQLRTFWICCAGRSSRHGVRTAGVDLHRHPAAAARLVRDRRLGRYRIARAGWR
jgi:hypothetical protein